LAQLEGICLLRIAGAADQLAVSLWTSVDADLMREICIDNAKHLNDAGIMTLTGRQFLPQILKNYLLRY
jgi:hypothetical protein